MLKQFEMMKKICIKNMGVQKNKNKKNKIKLQQYFLF